MLKTVKIASYEMGLYFRNGEFKGLLAAGRHWFFDPLLKTRVTVVSQRDPWLVHDKLDVIVKSGALNDRAVVIDLKDHQRALVWVDGRFSHVLPPGLYAYWTDFREVTVEIVDARSVRFAHKELQVITRSAMAERVLEVLTVEPGHVGVLYVNGAYVETLPPGRHAFWKNVAKVTLVPVDLREAMYDVAGQEIMTADKVTLRLNAVVTYRITDALKVVSITDDARQALYREAQLALRAVIGTRELDSFLTAKDGVAKELEELLRPRASVLGFELIAVGIRDVILPGEMKTLLNQVTEAKKAAEANLIARREETAAMRSQANTAKLLEDNPTLMRLRELEILEKVAASSKLNVVLGEKGLAERVVNLL
ncbi:MAG: peptidase [Deltaproteobacteria bacterium 21-66-5]|nr:MAG: peptidase [Deltaproteobacteria bacterium 21-66-5]